MAADIQIAARKISSVNPATGAVLREFEVRERRVRLMLPWRGRRCRADGLG
jgi:hypothetical protein